MEAVKTKAKLRGVIETRIGGRSENQDYYGYCDTPLGFAVTVCDGMGGMQGGQIASSVAVSSLLSTLLAAETAESDVDVVRRAICKANTDVMEAAAAHGISGMGTTLTLLIVNDVHAIVAHLGDSRVYQLRGHGKHFRTFDHSMVFDMVRSGVLTEEQARLSENSNIITNGLGIFPEVEPEIEVLPYESGDRFVLCTDGIWGVMKESDLLSMLTEKTQAGAVVMKVADTVDKTGRKKGGSYDNMTIAFIEVLGNSKLKEKMTRKAKLIIGMLSALLLLSIAGNVFLLCSGKFSGSQVAPAAAVTVKSGSDVREPAEQSGTSPETESEAEPAEADASDSQQSDSSQEE